MTTYAIISVGGKQYRVREGERLLVDRISHEEGKTFSPTVLLVGGDGDTQLAPKDVTVTARVVMQQRGPKIRIGKYRQRTGYRRHTGFRAALTQVEIESIGAKKGRATAKPAEAPVGSAPEAAEKPEAAAVAEKPNAAAKPKVEAAAELAAEKIARKPAARKPAAKKKEEGH